jgi:3-deoxy-D-manno-octulosonic-acid transferase
MYFLYSVLSAAGVLLLSPYFLIKGLRQKKYLRNLPERFAWRFPPELGSYDIGWTQGRARTRIERAPSRARTRASSTIWIHAVSVGEVLAAVPLASALAARFPGWRLVVSTTTATGQALARERLKSAEAVFYFPLDWRGPVRRALGAARPEIVILLETEIWPNFLREARRAKVPVAVVNGRISNRSFARFSRALRISIGMLRGFLRRVLNDVELFVMQSEQDAARLVELGAQPGRVVVAGNMKYDVARPESNPLVEWLEGELASTQGMKRDPVLVAGSVIAGEEAPVLEALAAVSRQWPGALLVMAPRKPERFDAAAALIEQSGRRVVRRSTLKLGDAAGARGWRGVLDCARGEQGSVLLLDTIGELAAVYRVADVVFVGGSLEPAGGHNPLEPAVFGKAPVFGSSMENFRDIAALLLRAEAAVEVRSGAELGAAWIALLSDRERRERLGRAARELVERNRGATEVTVERIAALLAEVRKFEPGFEPAHS